MIIPQKSKERILHGLNEEMQELKDELIELEMQKQELEDRITQIKRQLKLLQQTP